MDCATDTVILMHKAMDGEADEKEKQQLRLHLDQCRRCRKHFEQLQKTVTMVQGTSHGSAPGDLKGNIMVQLPTQNRFSRVKHWCQHHPVLMAAGLLLLLIGSYLFALWEVSPSVSIGGKGHVQRDDGMVIVPEDEVINGDLTVQNHDLLIKGKVNGQVVVINGQSSLQAKGDVSGPIKNMNGVMAWIGYQIKHLLTGFFNFQIFLYNEGA